MAKSLKPKQKIREINWEVIHPPYDIHDDILITASYRDRYGMRFKSFVPIDADVMQQIHLEDFSILLEVVWDEFIKTRNSRFDNPYLFWNFNIGTGRW